MINQLTLLYKELESIDMNILMSAQDHQLATLAPLLKSRETKLRGISCLMAELTQDHIEEKEHADLMLLQEQAINRSERIRIVLNQMYVASKNDFLKCNNGKARNTPYSKKSKSQHHIKA